MHTHVPHVLGCKLPVPSVGHYLELMSDISILCLYEELFLYIRCLGNGIVIVVGLDIFNEPVLFHLSDDSRTFFGEWHEHCVATLVIFLVFFQPRVSQRDVGIASRVTLAVEATFGGVQLRSMECDPRLSVVVLADFTPVCQPYLYATGPTVATVLHIGHVLPVQSKQLVVFPCSLNSGLSGTAIGYDETPVAALAKKLSYSAHMARCTSYNYPPPLAILRSHARSVECRCRDTPSRRHLSRQQSV